VAVTNGAHGRALPATRQRSALGSVWRARYVYLALVPTFLLLAIFNYYPFFSAFYTSFTQSDGINLPAWVGLQNFQQLFADQTFLHSFVNIVILTAAGIVQAIVPALIVAAVIFHLWSERWRYFYRVLLIIPVVVPGIVGVLLWRSFLAPANSNSMDVGVVNIVLNNVFGLHALTQNGQRPWLGDFSTVIPAIIFVGFPWVSSINVLIFLAGWLTINKELFDAAAIDGVTWWSRLWRIELPLIFGQIRLVLILAVIGGLQNYTNILILTQGGPGTASMVPGLYLYDQAFQYFNFGYACAIGVILFVIILAFTILNMRYARSSVEYEASS
jgi:raffinose/stachyose/melibiose transport system permease protein